MFVLDDHDEIPENISFCHIKDITSEAFLTPGDTDDQGIDGEVDTGLALIGDENKPSGRVRLYSLNM